MAKELTRIMSSLVRVRQDDGSFIPVFPITTANEVYVDIDNEIKLSSHLNGIQKSKNVTNIDEMYQLTPDDVNLNDFIKTTDDNKYFLVIDTNNLNSSAGYLEIITANNIGGPNGLAQLDSSGKVPLENLDSTIEFITYTKHD